jgi:hypothetical protein
MEQLECSQTDNQKDDIQGEGMKFDTGKLRYSLIPTIATKALAVTLTEALSKYIPNSWKTVPNAEERYMDALMRHLEAHRSGEIFDNDSGRPHLWHVLTNAVFLVWFQDNEVEEK